MTTWLVTGGVAAFAFVVTFLADGATRPDYRPRYHTVSALALGPRGWLQTVNFLVVGTTVVVAGLGVGRTGGGVLAPLALGAFGVFIVLAGAFRMDPMRGYPPGAVEGDPAAFTLAHRRHDGVSIAAFVALPIAIVAIGRLTGGVWLVVGAVAAAAFAALTLLFGAAWERDDPHTGAVQRWMLVVGFGSLGSVCLAAAIA